MNNPNIDFIKIGPVCAHYIYCIVSEVCKLNGGYEITLIKNQKIPGGVELMNDIVFNTLNDEYKLGDQVQILINVPGNEI